MEKVAEVVHLVVDASGVEDEDKRKAWVGVMLEADVKGIVLINIELGLYVNRFNFVITGETSIMFTL